MQTLQVRLVCSSISIRFEQSDLFRVLFERNGIERQDSRLNTNRSLDFLFESKFVGVELRRINLQFCYPHNRASDRFCSGTSLDAKTTMSRPTTFRAAALVSP